MLKCQNARPATPVHAIATALLVVLATISVVGFAFKWIIAVESLARKIDIARREEVGRNHEWPPTFVLSNMDSLMFAGNFKRCIRLSKHNVAERNRQRKLAIA